MQMLWTCLKQLFFENAVMFGQHLAKVHIKIQRVYFYNSRAV